MPEGPEVHREADRIRETIGEQRVESIRFAFPRLRRHRDCIEGESVRSVRARGKAMLIAFSSGLTVYSHNQLYGRWWVRRSQEPPRTSRQLRLAIHTARGTAWLYSASQIEVLDDEGLAEHGYLTSLGVEVLDPTVTVGDVDAWMRGGRFDRRALGGLLLDQGFVAGVGNYLRSDILFAARLHPATRLGALARHERARLARAIVRITRRAYRTAGVTNDPGRVARLRREGQKRSQFRHLAFARAGRPCWVCGGRIERITVAGRRLYLCAHCQPGPSPA